MQFNSICWALFLLVLIFTFNQAVPLDENDRAALDFLQHSPMLRRWRMKIQTQNNHIDSDSYLDDLVHDDSDGDRERRFGNTRYGRSI